MASIMTRSNFRISVAALLMCLSLCVVVLSPSSSWGFKSPAPSSEGTIFSGYRKAIDHYDAQGFRNFGDGNYGDVMS